MRHDSWNLTGKKEETTDAAAARRALADEFDAWAAAGRGESMEKGHMPTAGQALSRIDLPKVRVFLDLGTGNGFAVRHAAAHMPAEGTAVGLDVSPKMLETARQTTEAWLERRKREDLPVADARFIEAPFDEIPLPKASVDVAFSNEAIYYAPEIDAALRAVHDVLKPDGRFFCAIDFYHENVYSRDWKEKVGVPMTMDDEAGWKRRFEAAGFDPVETVRLLDPGPVPPLDEDADEAERTTHAALTAWKKEVGTLLIIGRRPA